jgi:hypothetical protein
MNNQLRFGFVLTMALAAWSHPVRAVDDSDKEAIRVLSNEAAADFDQRRYDAAREKFLRAYRIAQVPKLAVWAARANEKLGHLVAAYELYRQALSFQPNDLWKADTQQQAQKDAEEELGKLQPRIPKLTIVIEGARADDVTVRVDDKQVPSDLLGVERLADPGQRQIVGQRSDEVQNQAVTLTEGEKRQVVLKFRSTQTPAVATPGVAAGPASSAPSGQASAQSNGIVPSKTTSETNNPLPNAQPASEQNSPRTSTERTLGWIGVGVGAAGLALGTTTGLIVGFKYGDLNTQCPNRNCNGQHTPEVNTYNAMRTLSTVGFIVGGVATAAGVTLLLTTPKEKAPAQVGVWLSPNAAAVTGSF